jgi:hypothetical protein
MMLTTAVKAGLPVVTVTTSDLLNFPDIVKFECGKVPLPYNPKDKIQQGGLYWLRGSREHPASLYEAAYGQMAGAGATLIVVNPRKDSDVWFDAGEVPVPRKLVRSFLIKALGDGVLTDMLMPTLGGLTLKDIGELIQLTMARTGELTPHAVVATRRTCFNGLRGLTQVDTDLVHYDPPPFLAEWTAREKPFFLTAKDPRLVPRGLLFDGKPGTGKTAAAKYIADQFGVPLYRADVGGMKGKYVGDSETGLSSVIARIDREEPCLVLIDEVEKVFSMMITDSSGVTSSMMTQLLWWLQERTTRVLVLMTTNNRKKIPPELFREGRIDDSFVFDGFSDLEEALAFCGFVLKGFAEVPHGTEALVHQRVAELMSGIAEDGAIVHARLSKVVVDSIKQTLNS